MALQAAKKHRFGKAWMQEHVNDHWVQRGDAAGLPLARRVQAAGARRAGPAVPPRASRSSTSARRRGAGRRCCASGSAPRARIVAVDLLPMDPIRRRRRSSRRDFREDAGLAARRGGARRAPGRPCVVGHGPQSVGCRVGRPGAIGAPGRTGARIRCRNGCNRAAISSSRRSRARVSPSSSGRCSAQFDKVYVRKPKASRDRSREVYLVGKRHRAG